MSLNKDGRNITWRNRSIRRILDRPYFLITRDSIPLPNVPFKLKSLKLLVCFFVHLVIT